MNSDFKHEIRLQLHCIEKYGLESATKEYCKKIGIEYNESKKNTLLDYLVGKISFWKMVKGNVGLEYYRLAAKLNRYLNKRTIPIYVENDLNAIAEHCVLFASLDEENESASAFFYRGYIITCQHCLANINKDSKTGEAIFYSDPFKTKEIRAVHVSGNSENENDYLIYKPVSSEFMEISPSSSLEDDLLNNSDVIVLGYPFYNDDLIGGPSIIATKISAKRTDKNKRVIYVVNSSIKPGLSGGPVLNAHCQVIGYLVWGSEDEKASYFNNGFMPISTIDDAINVLENKRFKHIQH